MLARINTSARRHRRLMTLPAILLAALALTAMHSTMLGPTQQLHGHHDDGSGGGATTTLMVICLAILETGVAVGLTLAAIGLARRSPIRLTWSLAVPILRPVASAHGPPPPKLSQLQTFLR